MTYFKDSLTSNESLPPDSSYKHTDYMENELDPAGVWVEGMRGSQLCEGMQTISSV